MEEKNVSTKDNMSRADFFGMSVKKGLDLTREWATDLMKPFQFFGDVEEDNQWQDAGTIQALGNLNTPRVLYRFGKPFIFWQQEEKIFAAKATCSHDQFLLQFITSSGTFFCAQCQKSYQTSDLSFIHTKMEQGKLFLRA